MLALQGIPAITLDSGGGASAVAGGTLAGSITATTGDASLFATGTVTATVTAGGDASIGSLAGITGGVVAAGGGVYLLSLGALSSNVTAGEDVFAWGYGGVAGLDITADGSATVLTNGIGSFSADVEGDVTAAALGGALSVVVNAGGNASLFGIGLGGNVTTGGSLFGTSALIIDFQPLDIGGSLSLKAIGHVTAVGDVDGDVSLDSHGGILGGLTVGNDVSFVRAMEAIDGSFVAADNVGTVISWSDILADFTAGVTGGTDPDDDGYYGTIYEVRAWNNIIGATFTAATAIGDVSTGGQFLGTMIAPQVGSLTEYDRSYFIDLPKTPVLGLGEFVSLTVDAYTELMDMHRLFQQAETAFQQRGAAIQGELNITMAQLNEALAEAATQRAAILANIQVRGDEALDHAEAQINWAIERGQVAIDGAHLAIAYYSTDTKQVLTDAIDDAKAHAAGMALAASEQFAFLEETAAAGVEMFQVHEFAAMQQFDWNAENRDELFVGTFIARAESYALDVLQETISEIEFAVAFLPGGFAVSYLIGLGNALISAARGAGAGEAVASAAFPVVLAGVGKAIGKAASTKTGKWLLNGARRLAGGAARTVTSRFVRFMPGATRASAKVFCGADGMADDAARVAGGGCFVGDTEVVYIEPFNTSWLVAGGGLFLALPAGAIVFARRRKRTGVLTGDSVDSFLTDDSFDIMVGLKDGDDEMPEQLSHDNDFQELCDQLFHAEGESTDEDFWNPSAEECLAEAECPPDASKTGLSYLVTTARVRSIPADKEAASSIAPTTVLAPPVPTPKAEATDALPDAESKRLGRSTRRWLYAGLGILIWAAVLAMCLHKGMTPRLATKPIEQFQVGMVVPGDKIRGDNDLRYGEKVDPTTWKHLFVEGTKADGSRWDADLLMPPEWLEQQQARVGGEVNVTVPECGIDGNARVVSLRPCPDIPDLDGRVVTAVFRHHSAQVLDLHIEGLAEPIGVTANHPFWSEDRGEFVKAGELCVGERLREFDGELRQVVGVTLRLGFHTVHNLQVNVDHAYHVTEQGILVHNTEPCVVRFAHGTHAEWVASITNALDEEIAKSLSRRGRLSHAGAFDTFPIGPPGAAGEGLQAAFDFSHRHAGKGERAVMIGEIDLKLFNRLKAKGLIEIENIPGIDVPQWRFLPEAYELLN